MTLSKQIFFSFFLAVPGAAFFAQVSTDTTFSDDPLQQQIEILAEQLADEDADLTTLRESLEYYSAHPLNLNSATQEELSELMLLDDIQINNLIAHRNRFGHLMNIYELQAVEGFDLQTIYKILPYVKVSVDPDRAHFSAAEMWKHGRHEIVLRDQRILENRQGYTPADSVTLAENPNARYLGSSDHLYARYRFTYGNFVSAGFIADKDAGEEFFKGSQKQGFDFYSAHLAV
ncbi:MAG TPA: helix-hairpin-helix domain-containing protein, partial [Bacteroidia bacterium]|nr:helix-hairpin-helix domain-containing protein [Bacteroidia bacterium]